MNTFLIFIDKLEGKKIFYVIKHTLNVCTNMNFFNQGFSCLFWVKYKTTTTYHLNTKCCPLLIFTTKKNYQ